MKRNLFKSFLFSVIAAFVSFVYFAGCSNNVTPSLYSGSPTSPSGATPEITTVDPPSEALAAVTTITINGKNFIADTSAVRVYFGGQVGKILTASPTQLTVISPNISGSLKLKISTNTAELFSNSYDYKLEPASQDYYPDASDQADIPMAVIADNSGIIYTSNASKGVFRVPPDSVATLYSVKGGETYWSCMRFGKDGVMYAVRGLQAIFTIPAGGGVRNSAWVVLSPNSIKISKIDFDPLGNMWAAGTNSNIYRIKPDKSYDPFPFDHNVTAMRVFVDGSTTYLYTVVQDNSATTVMRIPLDANDNPGTPETYFDLSGKYGTDMVVNDITFAADGEMLLATSLPDEPVIYINPDKSTGPLYPGILLSSPALSLAWGSGYYLYYVRSQINDASGAMLLPNTVVKLNLLKDGAPYYGM